MSRRSAYTICSSPGAEQPDRDDDVWQRQAADGNVQLIREENTPDECTGNVPGDRLERELAMVVIRLWCVGKAQWVAAILLERSCRATYRTEGGNMAIGECYLHMYSTINGYSRLDRIKR